MRPSTSHVVVTEDSTPVLDRTFTTFCKETFRVKHCTQFDALDEERLKRSSLVRRSTRSTTSNTSYNSAPLCQKCRLPQDVHLEYNAHSAKDGWIDGPTNAFGDVSFFPNKHDEVQKSKYVCLSSSTPMSSIQSLFSWHWQLHHHRDDGSLLSPTMVISVIGDVHHHDREKLTDALHQAVLSTDAWLISDGRDSSVATVVGDVLRRCKDDALEIVGLGITPWQSIEHRDKLVNDGQGEKQARMIKKSPDPRSTTLNADHSHFLLIDDYSIEYTSDTLKFRSDLERFIQSEDGFNSPIIQLLHGGDEDDFIQACISIEHGIPLIVCRGSGGAADLIDNIGKSPILAESYLKSFTSNQKCCQLAKNIVDHADLVQFITLDDIDSLDAALMSHLMTIGSGSDVDRLALAVQANRVNTVKQIIGDIPPILWLPSFEHSLIDEKIDMIELFISHGVISHVTRASLLRLYQVSVSLAFLGFCGTQTLKQYQFIIL